jgi:cytochrome c oxidase subunit 2
VQKGWGIFFGVVIAAILALCVVAAFVPGWWLPKNVASFGGDIDFLYYIILGFVTFFFVLTEAILVYTMCTYGHRPGHKSTYTHGSHKLEMFWTIVPAIILLYIAFAQVPAWAKMKSAEVLTWLPVSYKMQMDPPHQIIQVTARQWEWRMRYPEGLTPKNPREWADSPQFDDLHVPNELHTWKGSRVRIYLKTQDVIHSLFLPNLRLKQDALPGKTIAIWFEATESNVSFAKDFDEKAARWKTPTPENDWELACAELCGGSHYRMRGRLFVHPTKEDYDDWEKYARAKQKSHEPEKATTEKVARNAGE